MVGLVVDGADDLVGERLPSLALVRGGLPGPHGQRGVEQQHALACPALEVAVRRDGRRRGRRQLLVDVDQRRRDAHPALHREAQPVGLPRAVVRILAEDHHLGVGVRREVQRGEHLVGGGIHRVRRRSAATNAWRSLPVRLVELAPQQRVPVGRRPSPRLPSMSQVFGHLDRAALATLPTPLEAGPELPGGARLLGEARRSHRARRSAATRPASSSSCAVPRSPTARRSLVTVGAAQSNHCRMTAAAGAELGLEVHLVLSGDEPGPGGATGNQLLSSLFGAQLHYTGAADHHWGELEIARESVTDGLGRRRRALLLDPDRREHGHGRARVCAGVVRDARPVRRRGRRHRRRSCSRRRAAGRTPGLLAGRAAVAAAGRRCPAIIAIGVAKGVNIGLPDIAELADETLELMGLSEHGRPPATSRSTRAGSATTTECPPTPATRPSTGPPATVDGCWIAPTPARDSPGCSGSRARAVSRPATTSCSSTPAGGRPCSRWR